MLSGVLQIGPPVRHSTMHFGRDQQFSFLNPFPLGRLFVWAGLGIEGYEMFAGKRVGVGPNSIKTVIGSIM